MTGRACGIVEAFPTPRPINAGCPCAVSFAGAPMQSGRGSLLLLVTLFALGASQEVARAQATSPVRVESLTVAQRFAGTFSYIGGIIPSSSPASVMVSQPSERTLVVLSSVDSPGRTIGRQGEGPGEYRSLGRVGWAGKVFWVNDPVLRRLTLIDVAGRLLRTAPWHPGFDGVGEIRAPSLLGHDGGGTFVATGMRPGGLGVGAGIGERLFLVSTDSGVNWRILTRTTGPATCAIQTPQVSVPVPNCSMPSFTASGDGKVVVVVNPSAEDPKVVTVTSARAIGPQGYSIRLTFRDQPIPRSTQDSVRRYLEGRRLPVRLPPLPTSYPVVGRVLVDGAGNAYLEELVRGRPDSWVVLDASGRPATRLRLPAGAKLHAVTGGEFWASSTNDDGEPEVLLLRRAP